MSSWAQRDAIFGPGLLLLLLHSTLETEGENMVLVVAVNCSLILIGVSRFVPRSVLHSPLSGILLFGASDDDEEVIDTVFCLIVVNAVDWNGWLEPRLTRCTAPWDNVVVLRLQMPMSSSVLSSLKNDDEEEVEEEEEDVKDSMSTSRHVVVRLATFPQIIKPEFLLLLVPGGT